MFLNPNSHNSPQIWKNQKNHWHANLLCSLFIHLSLSKFLNRKMFFTSPHVISLKCLLQPEMISPCKVLFILWNNLNCIYHVNIYIYFKSNYNISSLKTGATSFLFSYFNQIILQRITSKANNQ